MSFSDGRALCYIVHHYHPSLLRAEHIRNETSLTYNGDTAAVADASFNSEDSFSENWTQSFNNGPASGRPEIFSELLSNEKENFRLLYEKVSELGGIPLMLKASDMSNTIPDEKVSNTVIKSSLHTVSN